MQTNHQRRMRRIMRPQTSLPHNLHVDVQIMGIEKIEKDMKRWKDYLKNILKLKKTFDSWGQKFLIFEVVRSSWGQAAQAVDSSHLLLEDARLGVLQPASTWEVTEVTSNHVSDSEI